MSQSEVAQLKLKIVAEYEAMKRGLTGLASGNAKHAFIDCRMKHIDDYHTQLTHMVGESEASRTIFELYTNVIG